MKSILICLSSSLLTLFCFAQDESFLKIYPNGFAYADSNMQKVRQFFNGQHNKFRALPPGPALYSKPQTLAHFIHFRRPPSDKLLQILKAGVSIDSLAKEYSGEIIVRNAVVVLYRRTSNNQLIHQYRILQCDQSTTFAVPVNPSQYTTVANKWIWNQDHYSDDGFTAIYCLTEPMAKPLRDAYAQMIRYQEFMIDTTNVYTDHAWENNKEFTDEYNAATERFMQYAKTHTGKPDSNFLHLLQTAIAANLKSAKYDPAFEQYVEQYDSRQAVLLLKRNRMESRGCTNDQDAWKHTLDIAKLAMETNQWNVFVNAHLYALTECTTWTRTDFFSKKMCMAPELQLCGLDLPSLLAGMTFQIDEEEKIRYGRRANFGRIHNELPDQAAPLQFLLNIIADEQLDYLNRTAFLKMFFEYNFYESNTIKRKENYYLVRKLVRTWPVGLSASVDWERYKPE